MQESSSKKYYLEKLKDPRWQKRRLEILSLNNFECQDCGAKNNNLHVHHLYYDKGREPWDYGDDTLMCLCDDCHTEARRKDDLFNEYSKKIKKIPKFLNFYSGFMAAALWMFSYEEQKDLPDIEVIDYEFALGVAGFFRMPIEKVISLIIDTQDHILKSEIIIDWVKNYKESKNG